MDIETALARTLETWRRGEFSWADANCGLSVGDYAHLLSGRDPCPDWRGRYRDENDTMRRVWAEGGLVAVVGKALTAIGFERVTESARGDVVVARVRGDLIAGIDLGVFTAFRAERGLIQLQRCEIVAAWRWPCDA